RPLDLFPRPACSAPPRRDIISGSSDFGRPPLTRRAPMPRCLLAVLIAVVAVILLAVPSDACPFCNAEGQTLTKEINLASLVIVGSIYKTSGGLDYAVEGSTEFIVDKVVKRHDILDKALHKPAELGGKEALTLGRAIPLNDPEKKFK